MGFPLSSKVGKDRAVIWGFRDFSLCTGVGWIEELNSGYWIFNPLVVRVRTSSYLRSLITQHLAFD